MKRIDESDGGHRRIIFDGDGIRLAPENVLKINKD
jgi:hypothetical protein